MNNLSVRELLDDCNLELSQIEGWINSAKLAPTTPVFTMYSLMRVTGTLEQSLKKIISDYFDTSQVSQVRNYIFKTFTSRPNNPTYDRIAATLIKFDIRWNEKFKNKMKADPNYNKICGSLNSLNDSRNEFAHGGHPTITFDEIVEQFNDAVSALSILDSVVFLDLILINGFPNRAVVEIIKAVNQNSLSEPFNAGDVLHVITGYSQKTISSYMSRYCVGNNKNLPALFERVDRGCYKLN